MEVDYINGNQNKKIYGMSRYEMEINKRISDITFNRIEFIPYMASMENTYKNLSNPEIGNNISPTRVPQKIMKAAWNMVSHIDRYRYQRLVKNSIKSGNIKHITFQDLAYLLNSIKMDKTIINCHDLIPWVYDKDRSSIWKSNMEGLKKADLIITVSEFSKQEIIKHLNYPPENIRIIPDAVDHEHFNPQVRAQPLERWGLSKDHKYIIYVGSETPRMNLEVLLGAISQLKKLLPNVKLLKIGDPQSYQARKKTWQHITRYKLEEDVIFLGYVSEEDLPSWYATADVLVYPCLYAGFGLPPLEAMACGTPVITSNVSSLPEVVGDAALFTEPHQPGELMIKLYEILTMDTLREKIVKKGFKQAEKFNWEDSALKTEELYQEIK
jgi:glycosyltransferase involved in cell wall biosynthesis